MNLINYTQDCGTETWQVREASSSQSVSKWCRLFHTTEASIACVPCYWSFPMKGASYFSSLLNLCVLRGCIRSYWNLCQCRCSGGEKTLDTVDVMQAVTGSASTTHNVRQGGRWWKYPAVGVWGGGEVASSTERQPESKSRGFYDYDRELPKKQVVF